MMFNQKLKNPKLISSWVERSDKEFLIDFGSGSLSSGLRRAIAISQKVKYCDDLNLQDLKDSSKE